ncbi:MAG: GTP cyclohydrolase [Gammaproteobacteria bacterium CG11_big_fil_rev_8_21_14_0_20_46_22]|nr:MAG: GTP cyclohydrolase [Gammaproteobacteria bacterium CG11_big_fil_rev_8_21_14_0_20_46_22]
MLIAISKYLKPLSDVDEHRPAHHAFLKALLAEGKLIASGRQHDSSGGVIMVKGLSREEFAATLAEDPFVKAGASQYTIVEFSLSFYNESFEDLLKD